MAVVPKPVGVIHGAGALDRPLRALGVPGERVPQHPDDRAAPPRGLLAGKRMLLPLDNAATEDQVRPLLVGAPGCLTLVTSRRRLPGLDHALPLSLDWHQALAL